MRSSTIFFLIAWGISSLLPAQSNKPDTPLPNSPEQFYARTDRPFYILGERVWYQVYTLFQTNESVQSKVIYADIISPEGDIVLRQKLKMTQANAMGDFELETHWNPGWYRIRLYSKWNMSFDPPQTFTFSFPVLNIPADVPDLLAADSLTQSPQLPDTPGMQWHEDHAQGIEVVLEQDVYSPRSPITVGIQLKDPQRPLTSGNVSVSVMQLAFFEEFLQTQEGIKGVKSISQDSYQRGNILYEPEKKFRVKMELKSAANKAISSNFIQGVVMQSGKMNYTKSRDGIANIEFGEIYGSSPIQFFDPNPFAIHPRLSAKLIEESLPLSNPDPLIRALPHSTGTRLYYQSYVDNLLADKLYQTSDVFAPTRLSYPILERTPSYSIQTEDYIQFEDIFHFIGEAILSIQIKKPPKRFKSVVPFTRGPMAGKMFTFPIYSEGNYSEPAALQYVVPMMYSVNDYLFYDSDLLLDLEWDNVESVELYRVLEHLQYQFGPAGKSGVLGFRTKDGKTPRSIQNAKHNIIFQGFHIPSKYQNPQYSSTGQAVSKIPDYRPVAYWNSSVFVPPNGPIHLTFSSIDAPGWYLIRVEGVNNYGDPIWADKLYQVVLPSD